MRISHLREDGEGKGGREGRGGEGRGGEGRGGEGGEGRGGEGREGREGRGGEGRGGREGREDGEGGINSLSFRIAYTHTIAAAGSQAEASRAHGGYWQPLVSGGAVLLCTAQRGDSVETSDRIQQAWQGI